MEVYMNDICDQVTGLEKILNHGEKRGELLHDSGPVLLREARMDGEVLEVQGRGVRG